MKNMHNYYGKLQVRVINETTGLPIKNAMVTIYRMGNPYVFIDELSTDKAGLTPIIELEAPSLEFSMKPSKNLPYSEYAIRILHKGLRTVEIYGVQVYPTQMSIQTVTMYLADNYNTPEIITIEPNLIGAWY